MGGNKRTESDRLTGSLKLLSKKSLNTFWDFVSGGVNRMKHKKEDRVPGEL